MSQMTTQEKAAKNKAAKANDSAVNGNSANVETVKSDVLSVAKPGDEQNPTSDVKSEASDAKSDGNGSDQTPPTPPKSDEQLLQELTDAYFEASDNITKLAGVRDRVLIAKANEALNLARVALEKHESVIAAKAAETKKAQERQNNIAFIAAKFGEAYKIDASFDAISAVNALIDADKADVNQPLRNALANVFGGKIAIAKPGETGTNVSAKKAKNDDTGNGKAPESGKYAEMKQLFDSGKTKAEMIAAGYTDSDFNNFAYKFRYIVDKATGGYIQNPKYWVNGELTSGK